MKRLLLYILVAAFPLAAQTPYDSLYLKNPKYKTRIAEFESTKTVSASVVFLGNSITFAGDWNTLLGRDRIVNQGIGSDNIPGMLQRLRFVYRLHPKLCFLMTGINDIYADAPVEKIFENYTKVIDTLRAKNITPIIQSTLHVNPKWKRTEVKNPEVKKLNALLQEYCSFNKIIFVDLNEKLSVNGVLKDEFTTDGVHLTPAAYAVWRELIIPIFQSNGL